VGIVSYGEKIFDLREKWYFWIRYTNFETEKMLTQLKRRLEHTKSAKSYWAILSFPSGPYFNPVVSDTGNSQTFEGNLPLYAGGISNNVRLCNLAIIPVRISFGVQRSKK